MKTVPSVLLVVVGVGCFILAVARYRECRSYGHTSWYCATSK